ncbi:MAG: hypothetical protein ABIH03_10030, partial [Pseudomonadota bacterium]
DEPDNPFCMSVYHTHIGTSGRHGPWYSNANERAGGRVVTGDLSSVFWRDAPVMEQMIVSNALDRTLNISLLEGISQTLRACANGEGIGAGYDKSRYLNHSLADESGCFSAVAALPAVSWTNLWNTLHVGWYADDTFVGFREEEKVSTTEGNITNRFLRHTNLTERIAVAESLRWTKPDADWANCATGYSMYYGCSTVSWDAAKSACETNVISAGGGATMPRAATWGWRIDGVDSPTWHAYAVVDWGWVKVANLCTDIAHTVDFYVMSTNFDRPTVDGSPNWFATNITDTWDANGESLTNGPFLHRHSASALGWAHTLTSGPMCNVGFPDWVSEPLLSYDGGIRGYQITNAAAVAKWDFLYCTNKP